MTNYGQAFPAQEHNGDGSHYHDHLGMTLRDYFAAKAMQGILAGDHPITHGPDPLVMVASIAYDQADAMLAAGNRA